MAQGLSDAAAAADLHLAIKTVEAHEHRRVLAVLTILRA
jgi:DNA-binding NarL/FixJ family response regulator